MHSDMETMGRHNTRLGEVRLALRSGRLTADGWLAVEGPHLLEEARSSGIPIGEVFLRQDVSAPTGDLSVHRLGDAAFRRLEATRHGQGVVALVRPPRFTVADMLGDAGILLVLCGLQDPGNVGAILRLADAFACSGCLAVGATASFYNDKVVRASAGSLFRAPHAAVPNLGGLLSDLRSAGVRVVGTAPRAATPVGRWDWSQPTAVLLGNEGGGLSPEEIRECESLLGIPMPGAAESLNTAHAAAILLYESVRGRGATPR
jgi:TrmH family RNA methyltransferase